MLNEKEASQLSDVEFKELVIRKLKSPHGITKNYRETTAATHRNYRELTENYINKKSEIETIKKD